MNNPTPLTIPAELRDDSRLSWTEKAFLAIVHNLEQKNGWCWAGNAYLAKQFDSTVPATKMMISRLKEKGALCVSKDIEGKRILRTGLVPVAYATDDHLRSELENRSQAVTDASRSVIDASRSVTPIYRVNGNRNNKESDECEKIYQAYPKKVGKPDAIRAIKKAVKKVGFEKLMEFTEKYSLVRMKAEDHPAYTPYPSTWFNQERYLDDPSTWGQSGSLNASSEPRPGIDYQP